VSAEIDPGLIAAAEAWRDEDPDPATRAEVDRLLTSGDEAGLRERFGDRLEFGTAGLRGPIGAGPSRMNRALVRRATAGLGRWLLDGGAPAASGPAVVGFDARHGSAAFAADAAAVLTGLGVGARRFTGFVPTPVLAFAVLHQRAAAGVMVTASHNPPADNGYKVYAGDGAQIVPPMDTEISRAIDAVGPLTSIPLDEARTQSLGDDVVAAYIDAVVGSALAPRIGAGGGDAGIRIAYTPMHGVGRDVAVRVLEAAGFAAPAVVPLQAEPDPDFPTVSFPNPEEPGAMDLLLALARDEGADVAIANDPDADRLAVAVPSADVPGGWRPLTGDEIGTALGDWLLESTSGSDRLVATTIVSSSLLGKLAAEHGIEYEETLTGFKWLARAALARPDLRPVYAYEEALGSCVGDVVRDKDGISAALAFAGLVAAEKAAGRSVLDRLADVARRHGHHLTRQLSIRYEGGDAIARAQAVVDRLAAAPPTEVGGLVVTAVEDLRPGGVGGLPPSDVVRLHLDGGRVIVRPSGTEPKLKAYIEIIDPDERTAKTRLAEVESALPGLLE
jgi:phosphomannomutase